MKSSTAITASLVLNLGLIACVGYLLKSRNEPMPGSSSRSAESAPHTITQFIVKGSSPRVITLTNVFNWTQLETEDYREYIERLRSIGCPEQTIRDIVIADLDKLLAPRMHAIYGRRPDLQYWHSEEEELANDRDHREWIHQEQEINREKREVILDLLGVDLVRERMKMKGHQDYYERRLGFLPEDKRTSVRLVLEQYDGIEKSLRQRQLQGDGFLTEAERAELNRIQANRQEELAGVLSPGELQLYELWMSPTANSVRYAFYGMEPTEEEFLTVYELRKAFDAQWLPDQLNPNDDTQLQQWSQAREELDQQLAEALGPERYQEYKRSEDPHWHRLNAVMTRHSLPRETAGELYQMKEMLRETNALVENDPNLTPEQKTWARQEVKAETHRRIQEMIGADAFQDLVSQEGAQWLE